MLIAGVDDAGRGAIIGPLVIAGILVDEKDIHKLTELGVRDSKLLSPKRRKTLEKEIKKIALKYHVVRLLPKEIDRFVESRKKFHKLNRLEAQAMAEVLEVLKPDIAYVDASDILAERFKQHILEHLSFKTEIISEHKADRKYPVVSAASIIAKTERDRAIQQLQEKYGDIGCGYPTDPKTIQFLETLLKTLGEYPDFVRKSWKPAKRITRESKSKQKSITENYSF